MRRKHLFGLLLLVALLVGLAGLAQAEEEKSFYWKRFDVDITILGSGDLQVVETQEGGLH